MKRGTQKKHHQCNKSISTESGHIHRNNNNNREEIGHEIEVYVEIFTKN